VILERTTGLEPVTSCLASTCSNLLSYVRMRAATAPRLYFPVIRAGVPAPGLASLMALYRSCCLRALPRC
jgi:hypothetical protein